MVEIADYNEALSRCVRCGTCKTLCPTYLTTHNESMGARGRIALLSGLEADYLSPGKGMAERIFSCMLCGACENTCPVGINIPEIIYSGRKLLRKSFKKRGFMRTVLSCSAANMDMFFFLLKWMQRMRIGFRTVPVVASKPFKKNIQLFKKIKKIGRIALFAGCSVNYFHPELGNDLSDVLLLNGYEVVVFRGEYCCGAPFRSLGLEDRAKKLAEKNIEHFNRVRAEAIVSMCPTCTMVIKKQYPLLAGSTIDNIMDVNEFLIASGLINNLETDTAVVTYHDPCHLGYGLGIKDEPRKILNSIKGIKFVEMEHPEECCGFAGLFSMHYSDMSEGIGTRKLDKIIRTSADTVVTSCPGCVMQLEKLRERSKADFKVRHIVEIVREATAGSKFQI